MSGTLGCSFVSLVLNPALFLQLLLKELLFAIII